MFSRFVLILVLFISIHSVGADHEDPGGESNFLSERPVGKLCREELQESKEKLASCQKTLKSKRISCMAICKAGNIYFHDWVSVIKGRMFAQGADYEEVLDKLNDHCEKYAKLKKQRHFEVQGISGEIRDYCYDSEKNRFTR